MEKKPTSSAVMGLLVGLALIVCSLIVFFAELYTQSWSQFIGFVLLFIGILLSVLMHAKEINYREGFGALFGFGFKVTAAATVIMILFMVVQGFIFPDFKTRILEMTRLQMGKRPNITEEQIDTAMQWMERNFTLMMILGILFWYLIIGAVASLIGAAVSKKNRPDTNFETI